MPLLESFRRSQPDANLLAEQRIIYEASLRERRKWKRMRAHQAGQDEAATITSGDEPTSSNSSSSESNENISCSEPSSSSPDKAEVMQQILPPQRTHHGWSKPKPRSGAVITARRMRQVSVGEEIRMRRMEVRREDPIAPVVDLNAVFDGNI